MGIRPLALLLIALTPSLMLAQDESTEEVASQEPQRMEPTITERVMLQTSLGEIEIELFGEDAPFAVKNFVGLSDSGFYDGILFHRVVPGFVIQAGDPKTRDTMKRSEWGTGGSSIYGATFRDELNPAAPSYRRGYARGTVAMANRGPNTNTSQFFIVLADLPTLPKNYTIFGQVTPASLEIVDSIAATPTSSEYRDQPMVPIVIEATIVEAPLQDR